MDENRVKKLIHRATYRGFKEADIILGGFAKKYAFELSAIELDQFESLLAEKDHDIYDWVSGVQVVPDIHKTPLFIRIQKYKPVLG
jgi:antitoxin CptB